MSAAVVTDHLVKLVAEQVKLHGLVVWYDPGRVYEEAAKVLELPDTTVMRYEDSFFDLRWRIDQQGLMEGEEPPRLVIYVPVAQNQTYHALIEFEAAGVVMQPGQQPPARNTRLAVVARNALRSVLGEEAVVEVEKQVEAGRLTLADLDALAARGGEASRGVLTLAFGTGNSQEIALAFLSDNGRDGEIEKKGATGELRELLREFDFNGPEDTALDDLRLRLARHVLLTDLIVGLGQAVPSPLASSPIASTEAGREACAALAKAWRLRRDMRESYVAAARQVEQEFSLDSMAFEEKAIEELETFPAIERALLRHAEKRLLEATDGDVLTLAESRSRRFWCDAEPQLQTRWGLVASAAEVLLEAQRVEQVLKKAPASLAGVIREYAQSSQPWCLLDTYHRNMESRWHNFEPHGGDDENLEKLIIRARQRYVAVGSEVARVFVTRLRERSQDKGVLRQRDVFQKHVKPALGKEKIAYVWVDALRFEMGRELARLLGDDFAVEIQTVVAAAPTITEIGMAALLPGAHETAKVVSVGDGKLALEIGGNTIRDRKDRVAFLKERAGVAVFDAKLDDLLPKPSKRVREGISSAQLALVTSQEIDELCEQDNIAQARRQMDGVLNDLRRGVRVLADLGVERIVLAADHGHLFAEELSEDMKVEAPGGETVDLHRRVWVGRGGQADDALLRMPLSSLGMDGEFDLAAPLTFACFKCKGGARAYFHGGLSPQEALVPVLIMKPLAKPTVRTHAEINWQLSPGSQKLTTRFFSVQVGGASGGLFDIEPPKVRVELRAKGKVLSRAVSASYGFEESTGDVALRKDQADPKKIAADTITLMMIEETDQKTVALFLLDAATGAELSRLERIDVAIAM
ncbi:MAG: PglZ domain-containing protein [Rhodopirellula sp.]|nr:PglZ domain-containing protein [Rhodopirellula sp.]